MKKLIFIMLLGPVLAGCSAGLTDIEPAEKLNDLTAVCVREARSPLNFTPKELTAFITKSLEKKNIKTITYGQAKIPENCKYVLATSFKGKKELIVRGRMVLRENTSGTLKDLGEINYRYRGAERDIAKQTGIQGQIDRMISELFKNY
ncbi:hypothetical protein [Rodentibacter caecimuris]|uniref:Lipoprotein n=1 Tax=Rodentibacter caecimuris TaxID=1796644 RepID=A0ABX3KZZ8_9PAST|nr:hypothetical protein BKG89_02825 [Rodentibacter heylii]